MNDGDDLRTLFGSSFKHAGGNPHVPGHAFTATLGRDMNQIESSQQIERTRTACIPMQETRVARKWAIAFLCFAGLALIASSAFGQAKTFAVLPVDENIDKNLQTVQREASAFATARDISSFAANRARVIQQYYQQYVPAKLTQPKTPEDVNKVIGHAKETLSRSLRSGTPASRNLLTWLYGGLKPVAMGNYQPSARVIAIDFIAGLARPAQRGGLPRPYPFVLTDMRTIYDNKDNPDGVRAAALKGIESFVRLTQTESIDDAVVTELTTAMTELLTSPAPADRDPLAHAFLQRYAVNVLANLNPDEALGQQLVGVSTEKANPNLIAMHSVATFGRMKTKLDENDIDAAKLLQSWASRVLEDFEVEVERITRLDKRLKAKTQPRPPESFVDVNADNRIANNGMGMGMDEMLNGMMMDEMNDEAMAGMMNSMDEGDMAAMMGGMMGGMGMTNREEKPQPPEIVATRKKLNHSLQQILLGIIGTSKFPDDEQMEDFVATNGVLASTPEPFQEDARRWLTAFKSVSDELNNRSVDQRPKFLELLKEQVIVLTALSKGEEVEPRRRDDGPSGIEELFGPDGREDSGTGGDDAPPVDGGLDDLFGK
ncbi:MAG: hypothetical protein AAF802_03495 [Planctomycetota bacterium]